MVPPDPQGIAHELRRQVPVAQVPGDLHQVGGVVGVNFDHFLRFCENFDDPTVFKFQTVAMAQMDRHRFIQQEGQSGCACQDCPAPIPVFPVKRDPVGDIAGPSFGLVDFRDADHAASITFAIMAWKAGRSLRRLK